MKRQLAGLVIALGTLAAPAFAGAVEVSGVVKVTGEVDTNPDRLVGGGARSDGVVAAFASVDVQAPVGAGSVVRGRGQLGTRAHGTATDRDELVMAVDGSWRHYTRGPVFFGLAGSARDRVERTSTWDYTSLGVRGAVGVDAGPVRVTVEPAVSRFVYRPVPDLDRTAAGGRGRLDVFATDAWTVSTWGGVERRDYAGDRCCDDAVGRLAIRADQRVDRLAHGAVAVTWAGPRARLEVGGSGWRNRSNSVARGWTRARADVAVSVAPVGDLVARLALVVQRTRFDGDVQIDDDLTIDDDNRNRLALTLDHPIRGDWYVEASARHLAEDFGAGASFARTVVGLGVAWRPSSR